MLGLIIIILTVLFLCAVDIEIRKDNDQDE
jgi:hypothetical protein